MNMAGMRQCWCINFKTDSMETIEVNAKVSTIEIDNDKIIINLKKEEWKAGDLFIPTKPKNLNEYPGWADHMNIYEGKVIQVESINKAGNLYSNQLYWNPSWCKKVKVEYKEPIIGEMAIFWDDNRKIAYCAEYNGMTFELHYSNDGACTKNAILFESTDQFKEFIK